MTTEPPLPPGDAPAPPNWLADALRSVLDELGLFARTYWGITVHPMRFAEEWASGKSRALNPLAFMATASSLQAALFQGASLIGYPMGDDSFSRQILQSAGPFVPYAVLGAMAHVFLLRVTPRRRFLDSVGVALYAGGPALLGYVFSMVVPFVAWLRLGKPDPKGHGLFSVLPAPLVRLEAILLCGIVALFVRSLWLGLAGLRGRRWIVSGLASLTAVMVLGLALGRVNVDAPLGIQLVIYRSPGAALGWSVGLHD